MKKMQLKVLGVVVLFAVLTSASCAKSAQESGQSSNPNIKVETLFVHDSIKMYRFYDHGRPVYFAAAGRNVNVDWSHTESCGKNCTRSVSNQTMTVGVPYDISPERDVERR